MVVVIYKAVGNQPPKRANNLQIKKSINRQSCNKKDGIQYSKHQLGCCLFSPYFNKYLSHFLLAHGWKKKVNNKCLNVGYVQSENKVGASISRRKCKTLGKLLNSRVVVNWPAQHDRKMVGTHIRHCARNCLATFMPHHKSPIHTLMILFIRATAQHWQPAYDCLLLAWFSHQPASQPAQPKPTIRTLETSYREMRSSFLRGGIYTIHFVYIFIIECRAFGGHTLPPAPPIHMVRCRRAATQNKYKCDTALQSGSQLVRQNCEGK